MANNTQLARITAPSINEVDYANKMQEAFDKINENFKKIASLPFLQGVQGDSYQSVEVKIWEGSGDDGTSYILTEEGALLLNNIFNLSNIQAGYNYRWYTTNNKSPLFSLNINGVSPISSFISKSGKITNNSLYFYAIYDDSGEIKEKQLGQYFYFIDGRLKTLGESYYDENIVLDNFNDYSGFYRFVPNKDQKYQKMTLLPSIYYDRKNNDICWKFNGEETGISAIGVPGSDGKDAGFQFVRVTSFDTTGSSDVDGVFDSSIRDKWDTNQSSGNWKKLVDGIAIICIQDKNDITKRSIAYGEIHLEETGWVAYWSDDTVLNPLLTFDIIQSYFFNIGSSSNTPNAPHFLAIPQVTDRRSNPDTKAHVIRSGGTSSLIFEHGTAFNDNGIQLNSIAGDSNISNIELKEYNLHITGTKGKINRADKSISSVKIYDNAVDIDCSGGNIKEKLYVGGSSKLDGDVNIKNSITAGGSFKISGSSEIGGSSTIKGDITVSGKATFDGGSGFYITGPTGLGKEACFKLKGNSATVLFTKNPTEKFYLSGKTVLDGDVNINGTLYIRGNSQIYVPNKLTVTAGPTGNGDLSVKGNLECGKGATINEGATINGGATISGNATINNIATINGGATMNGGATIYGLCLADAKRDKLGNNVEGVNTYYRLKSGGILSGTNEKRGWSIDDSVPNGSIVILTGAQGAGWRKGISTGNGNYLSIGDGWVSFCGGIYKVSEAYNSRREIKKTLYLLSSPYVDKQDYVTGTEIEK